MEYVRLTSASEVWCPGRKLLTQRSRFLSPSRRWTFVDPEIWRGPGSRWTQILDAFTPSAWISGLDPRIRRGSGSRWAQILEGFLPSATRTWGREHGNCSFLPSPSRKSRGGGTPKPIGAQKHSQSCCFIIRNCCFSINPVLSPLWEPPPHSPWGRNVGIAQRSQPNPGALEGFGVQIA